MLSTLVCFQVLFCVGKAPTIILFYIYDARVRMDVVNSLKMENPYVKIGSFDRGNLFYGVKLFNRTQSFVHELAQEVSKFVCTDGSTIIYCTTIKDVYQVHTLSG